jgi:lysozyme
VTTLPGLDVSVFQSVTPSLAGKRFLIARATFSVWADSKYPMHTTAAKKAGIVHAAYHFGTGIRTAPSKGAPQQDTPIANQVKAFLAAAGDALILLLDVESNSIGDTMTTAQAAQFVSLLRATDPSHRKILLYHSLSGFPLKIGQDGNWVADYDLNTGSPGTAPTIPWMFWQYTSRGHIAGYTGNLDLDQFNGTQAQLNALAGIVAPPAPAYPPSLGPKPANADGWISVRGGTFEQWIDTSHKRSVRGRKFSVWVRQLNLLYDGKTYPGYRVVSPKSSYHDWTIFAGSTVAWHKA